MGARRSPTPNEAGARDVARVFYPDLDSVDWIPSDDADVFRLSLASGREPRILKMATHGIRAVWREIGAFPATRRLGIPGLLEFEHTSDDLPDLGIEFHVTRELAQPQQASRAMAELWTSDRPVPSVWPTGLAIARAESSLSTGAGCRGLTARSGPSRSARTGESRSTASSWPDRIAQPRHAHSSSL